MQRDEETLEAITYANRLPDDLSGRQVYVLDPMLATGGSMADAIRFLIERGADDITAVTLLSAPRASRTCRRRWPTSPRRSPWSPARSTSGSTRSATSCPGLGDAGDRLYGLAQ